MALSQEMKKLAIALADAIKSAIHADPATARDDVAQPKPSPFAFSAYRCAENTTVADYFTCFEWALNLSKIPNEQHANYLRVHMGTELNEALKFLIAPKKPEECTYTDMRNTLEGHFDTAKNEYSETVKFRHITQKDDEPVAQFSLRLRQQAATYCKYGEFLDRMLIEQLLHGLSDRSMCDEIIVKKPTTFKEAYAIAHALEAT